MHNLKDDYFDDGSSWWNWNGPITNSIDSIIRSFLETLVGHENLPKYALLIAQKKSQHG